MYDYNATLVRVIDGDTCIFAVDVGFKLTYETSFRFARINAPELSTPEGPVARDFLISQLPTGPGLIHINSKKPDKYGRWLAEVFVGTVNINDLMVSSGNAVVYP